jgi:Flp pilus assembly protein TadB
LTLPQTADGKQLTWLHSAENPLPSLLVLTVLLAFCTYLEMDSRIHQKAEKRKAQLMMDYPDLMWKMTMLLGAGLSIKGTFSRISSEYLREKKEKEKHRQRKDDDRYVYEEVTYTCYEMENGIPEAEAYERFGKRCQLPEYIRLGSVLSQNLRKGAKGLTALLETEAASSMNERKNHARKIGEQAGTKLLLPMVLMLVIVLVILMVPAFLSF